MTPEEKASKKIVSPTTFRKWVYTIKSNPHPRGHPKHVEWHNRFYDECQRLNRKIK